MDGRYIVETQKTADVIKDFILFKRRAQNSHGTFHLCLIGAGMTGVGYTTYPDNSTAGINLMLTGAILLIFALFRHNLTVSKFKKSDQAYLEKWNLTYVFTNKELQVYRNGELFEKVKNYRDISSFYEDEKNYYLGINNEDMYVLPKKDFTTDSNEGFADFITEKSSQELIFLPASFITRFKRSFVSLNR